MESLYSPTVRFTDPVVELSNRDALTRYFEHLDAALVEGRTVWDVPVVQDSRACLGWTMTLTLRRRARHPVVCRGVSVVEIADDLIVVQRDVFDMGALVYEQVPLLGGVVRAIKRRLASAVPSAPALPAASH